MHAEKAPLGCIYGRVTPPPTRYFIIKAAAMCVCVISVFQKLVYNYIPISILPKFLVLEFPYTEFSLIVKVDAYKHTKGNKSDSLKLKVIEFHGQILFLNLEKHKESSKD